MLDANQKQINSKRFFSDGDGRAWKTVTVPNRFKPTEYKYSQNSETYFVQLVDLQPRKTTTGVPGTKPVYDVIHVRAKTPDLLRQEIESRWPQAVFSTERPQAQPDDLKAAYKDSLDSRLATQSEIDQGWERLRKEYGTPNKNGFRELYDSEITEEMARRCGVRKMVFIAMGLAEQQKFEDGVIKQHKLLSDEMTDAERTAHIGHNLNSFMLGTNGSGWADWFRQFPNNFFSYPNGEYRNRERVLKYCADHGFSIPIEGILDEAMRFLLARNMLYLKQAYKRSERDELNSIQEYSEDVAPIPVYSPAQIADATQRLRKALPNGTVPSQERIEATARVLGISDDLLSAIQNPGQPARPEVSSKSATDLKRDLQSIRAPVPADLRRRGY
jgi:hypothetical protein